MAQGEQVLLELASPSSKPVHASFSVELPSASGESGRDARVAAMCVRDGADTRGMPDASQPALAILRAEAGPEVHNQRGRPDRVEDGAFDRHLLPVRQ
eukprot:3467835-Pleurochrysis_carterae.AAC.1